MGKCQLLIGWSESECISKKKNNLVAVLGSPGVQKLLLGHNVQGKKKAFQSKQVNCIRLLYIHRPLMPPVISFWDYKDEPEISKSDLICVFSVELLSINKSKDCSGSRTDSSLSFIPLTFIYLCSIPAPPEKMISCQHINSIFGDASIVPINFVTLLRQKGNS